MCRVSSLTVRMHLSSIIAFTSHAWLSFHLFNTWTRFTINFIETLPSCLPPSYLCWTWASSSCQRVHFRSGQCQYCSPFSRKRARVSSSPMRIEGGRRTWMICCCLLSNQLVAEEGRGDWYYYFYLLSSSSAFSACFGDTVAASLLQSYRCCLYRSPEPGWLRLLIHPLLLECKHRCR